MTNIIKRLSSSYSGDVRPVQMLNRFKDLSLAVRVALDGVSGVWKAFFVAHTKNYPCTKQEKFA